MQAVTFKNPLTKYAPASDKSKYSPNFLSKHQYIRDSIIKIGLCPKVVQNRKKESKIPPVSSLINCKNSIGSIKMLLVSHLIISLLLFNFCKLFEKVFIN